MALTYTEMESTTRDHFLVDGGKAVDIYFKDSYLKTLLMKEKRGLWERPEGGLSHRIPFEFDLQNGGAYDKTDTISSDDKETINGALFLVKYYYGNATIHRIDEQKNSGPYAEVKLLVSKVEGAQKKISKDLSTDIYALATDSAKTISGLNSICATTTTTAYGGVQEADLLAADGTYPWKGIVTTTTEGISLAVIRTLRSSAKIHDGADGKPNIGVMPEALFNIIAAQLQAQQRFTTSSDTATAGFTHVVFEGLTLAADDYCPSGTHFQINTNSLGFLIDKNGYFARDPWGSLTAVGIPAKTMKIFWDGNLICSNRKAQAKHTNLS